MLKWKSTEKYECSLSSTVTGCSFLEAHEVDWALEYHPLILFFLREPLKYKFILFSLVT